MILTPFNSCKNCYFSESIKDKRVGDWYKCKSAKQVTLRKENNEKTVFVDSNLEVFVIEQGGVLCSNFNKF